MVRDAKYEHVFGAAGVLGAVLVLVLTVVDTAVVVVLGAGVKAEDVILREEGRLVTRAPRGCERG